MRRFLTGGTTMALACLISACGSDSNPVDRSATLDFYNQLTNSKLFARASSVKVDVFTDASSTALFQNQKYSTTGNGDNAMVSFTGGSANFTVSGSNGGSTLTQASNDLQNGTTYTTVLMGDLKGASPTPNIVSYPQTSASVDKASVRVRVINTLSLLGKDGGGVSGGVDLTTTAGGTSIATSLAYGDASDYVILPKTGRTLSIDVTQGSPPTLTTSCRVQAGNSYDVILAYVNFRGSNSANLKQADVGIFCHQTP